MEKLKIKNENWELKIKNRGWQGVRIVVWWVQKLKNKNATQNKNQKRRLKMSYEEAKKIVDLLIDTMILKEDDRNITMDLLLGIDK